MLDICNYYEQLVKDRLWKINEARSEAFSRMFIEDVACLALNKLPPCYIRKPVDMGTHLTESAYLAMIDKVDQALAEAIEQASRQPHEDREV